MVYKLERARTAAIILAILFYIAAKISCYWTPLGWEHMMRVVMPVIFSIVTTAQEAFGKHGDEFCVGLLALQASMLGLAILSSVVAYAIHVLCKITERNGLSG